ncbi:MAG: NADH:flavin oxidoreductase [Lachnospiraceae bacterium]|nr:NADH:flavin oxidoreductase [Lachnospiraceae bacterium]
MTLEDRINIGTLELNNRLVMPPMATWKMNGNGIPQDLIDYYAARAGRIGLIVTEFAYISPEGMTRAGQLSLSRNEDIPEMAKLAAAIHTKGRTKIFAQINHAGAAAGYEVKGSDDIQRIIKAFADAAVRVKKAGFDGVEIHAAHGYLLNQFYSPLTNHRKDAYSADTLEGRTRLSKEVVEAVRAAVGNGFPISIRFGSCDYQEGGSTIEEAGIAARIYETAGADMISVTGGMNGFMVKGVSTPGWFSPLSAEVRKNVGIPVLLTGGIRTRETADELLQRGAADLIGIGRPILKSDAYINEIL